MVRLYCEKQRILWGVLFFVIMSGCHGLRRLPQWDSPTTPPKWVSSPRRVVGLSYHGSRDEKDFPYHGSRKISDFHATAIVLYRKNHIFAPN